MILLHVQGNFRHKTNEVLDIDVKKLCFEENSDINITEYTRAAMVPQALQC